MDYENNAIMFHGEPNRSVALSERSSWTADDSLAWSTDGRNDSITTYAQLADLNEPTNLTATETFSE